LRSACKCIVGDTKSDIEVVEGNLYTNYDFKITETINGQEGDKTEEVGFGKSVSGFPARNSFVNCRTSHAVSVASGSADGFWG
jgi:hypothetical protein